MRSPGIKRIRWLIKPVVHGLLLAPFSLLALGFYQNALGVNPIEVLTHEFGEWGLRILLITLAISPLAKITHSGWLVQLRRLVGLYCFFYVMVHFAIYLLFDLSLDFAYLLEDIIDRPYITVGFGGFLILTILALTSPTSIRRKMARNWTYLHRLIYLAGILAVIHFLWITRVDDFEPLVYGLILAVLLLYRLPSYLKRFRMNAAV